LGIVVLAVMPGALYTWALEDEALYERAAVRWVARFADECPEATLDQVAEALGALRSMTWDVDEGARRLHALCDLHHV
jgi:hypothetical protein